MKKILVTTEVFYPENFVINDLVLHLDSLGYKVDIVTQSPSYPFGKVFEGYKNLKRFTENYGENAKIHRFKVIEGYKDSKLKKIQNYRYFVKEGKKLIKELGANYDLVFAHQTGPLTHVLTAIYAAKLSKCPLYVWTQDIWPDSVYSYGFKQNFLLDKFLDKLIRRIYKKCDKIFISSANFKDTIQKYTSSNEIYYMPSWLDKSIEEKSKIKLDKNKFNLTFTGNVSLYQNLENIIKAMEVLNNKDFALNIVGDGSVLESLKNLVKTKAIANVNFYGRQKGSTILDILENSDACLLSLIANEGIQKIEPLKLQSYLKSGKAIFGVLSGACKEIIESNNIGICASPSDINEIAQQMKALKIFAKNNTEEISKNSAILMNTRYNREKIFKDFVAQIES